MTEMAASSGLVDSPEEYAFCFASLAKRKTQGLKPNS